MDTKSFFQRVLPTTGFYFSGRISARRRHGVGVSFGATVDWLAHKAAADDAAGHDSYFGCASYKIKSRKAADVQAVKAFWLDVDCGPGKPYATQKEGARTLYAFVQSLNLPNPLVVKSGRGLHVYWPLVEEIAPDAWRPVAKALKAACEAEGFVADPARTADIASILRVPGTRNHKTNPPLPVAMAKTGVTTSLAEMSNRLAAFLTPVANAAASKNSVSINDDLIAGVESIPTSAHAVAEQCAFIANIRDTRGNVPEPEWRAGLSVLRFTQEAPAICHEWSDGHPAYSRAETDVKLQQLADARTPEGASYGPATCAHISGLRADICSACPLKDSITSPVVLGRRQQAAKVAFADADAAASASAAPLALPPFYDYRDTLFGKALCRSVPNGDGGYVWVPFCATLFYPVARVRGLDGGYSLAIRAHTREGIDEFNLPCRYISDTKRICVELGHYGIQPMDTPLSKHVAKYLIDWQDKLRKEIDATRAVHQFGWQGKDFVLGRDVFGPTAKDKIIVPQASAELYADAVNPAGSLDEWKRVIDTAYNHPGQEALQFLVLQGFAAPLFGMLNPQGGVIVYAHSEGSGVGKTTAQRAALSAWGKWSELQLADKQVTINALWTLVGVFNSLPVVYDELTNISAEDASRLAYTMSNGRDKTRMGAKGGELALRRPTNWSTVMLASGNALLTERISQHRGQGEAEQVRVFEFTVAAPNVLTPIEANRLFPLLDEHYGHAGRVFIQFVVEHYDAILALLRDRIEKLSNTASVASRERFWVNLIACTMVAHVLCNRLGLLNFDRRAMRDWIFSTLADNRVHQQASMLSAADILSSAILAHHGRMLVTDKMGSNQTGDRAFPISEPVGYGVVARVIKEYEHRNDLPTAYFDRRALKQWCDAQNISLQELLRRGADEGVVNKSEKRMSLGRGTSGYDVALGGRPVCVEIFMEKLTGVASLSSITTNHQTGDKSDVRQKSKPA